jgi:glucokinase
VTPQGTLASEVLTRPTGKAFDEADLRGSLRALIDGVSDLIGVHPVAALGFGTAGVVRPGPLTQSDNLPRLNGVDLGLLVNEVAGVPVQLENDARCFTLAEARYGAGRGASDVCGLTLGTGVGCGIMIGGRLHRGFSAQAGEVWRIPLRGRPLEYALSGAGVVRSYQAAGGAPGVDAAEIASRARAGDDAARTAWRLLGRDVAFACAAIVSVVDPAVIVIGGSLAIAHDLFEEGVTSRLSKEQVRIAYSELGHAAGVIGAAALNIDGSR